MSVAQFMAGPGLAGITQLLDEHHLAVLGDDVQARRSFGRTLKLHLSGLMGSQVVTVPAGRGHDLEAMGESISKELNESFGLKGAPSDLRSITSMLRKATHGVRYRYLIWNDADEMLEKDVELFGRVTNALLSVAVEHEHVTPEPLILHRVIFIGGHKLGAYAEEEAGQFCSWLAEAGPWNDDAVDHVSRPPVLTYRLDG